MNSAGRSRMKYRKQVKYNTLQNMPVPKEKNFLGRLEDALPHWVPRVRINVYYNTSTTLVILAALAGLTAVIYGMI